MPSTSSSASSLATKLLVWYATLDPHNFIRLMPKSRAACLDLQPLQLAAAFEQPLLTSTQGYGHDGASAIKIHPFFRVIDWSALANGKVQ
jgi:hypothetical protein